MLKSWKRWVLFVEEKLSESRIKCSNEPEKLLKYSLVKENLEILKKKIPDYLKELKKLQNILKREQENAEEILQPEKRVLETKSVKKWFDSQEHKDEEAKVIKIWQDAMEQDKVTSKPYVTVANFARFILAITSKNRSSCFKFSNKDYVQKSELWLPDVSPELVFDETDHEKIAAPPKEEPNLKPNGAIIKLSGGGAQIKNQEAQTIYINAYASEFMQKFRDLKEIQFPGALNPQDDFFSNFENEPLADMTNKPGTLLWKFGRVTGPEKPTLNSIRRGQEPLIQMSPAAKSRIKDLQSHSADTGSGAYDKTSPMFRASWSHFVSNKEGSNPKTASDELDDNIKAKRAKIAEEDKKMRVEEAEKTLAKKPQRRKLTKSTKILPEVKFQLMEHLSSLPDFNREKIFPNEKRFKVKFYRLIDGAGDSKLRELEEKVFIGVKKDIEAELGESWDGSSIMNKKSDVKIISTIRNSFLNYEKNRLNREKSYFKFY